MSAPDTGAPEIRREALRAVVFWCLLTAVASTTFSIALSSIALGAAGVFWLFDLLRKRGRTYVPTALDGLFVAYCCVEIIVSFASPEPAHSFYNARRLLLLLIVQLFLFSVWRRRTLEQFFWGIAGCASLISLFELFSLTSAGGHLVRLSLFQYFLTEGGIKMIALLLLVPFIIDARVPGRRRIAAVIAALPLFAGLILNQTRSSWLGFIAGIAVLGVLRDKRLLIALGAFILLFTLFAPADLHERAVSIFDPSMSSNITRIHMISTGWRMFLDHPITGFGDVDLRKYYVTYTTPLDDAEGGHLHNNFMMLLVTLGAAGFLVMMAIFVVIAVLGLRSSRKARGDWLAGNVAVGAFAAYIGFHINGLFEWNFGDQEIAVLLWALVGMMIVAGQMPEAAKEGPAP